MGMIFDTRRFVRSFGYAAAGLRLAVAAGQNLRVQMVAGAVAVAAGWMLHISLTEWCILGIVAFQVLAMEVMNTAVERLTDLVAPERSRPAGAVKDIAAAAVLLSAFSALAAGLIIFLPKI